MLADLVVLSQDLFRLDPRRIHETQVLLTVFDGRVCLYPSRDRPRSPKTAR
jgi:predicted amidohydrolase YtcJ